jgi:hypothetical protein
VGLEVVVADVATQQPEGVFEAASVALTNNNYPWSETLSPAPQWCDR